MGILWAHTGTIGCIGLIQGFVNALWSTPAEHLHVYSSSKYVRTYILPKQVSLYSHPKHSIAYLVGKCLACVQSLHICRAIWVDSQTNSRYLLIYTLQSLKDTVQEEGVHRGATEIPLKSRESIDGRLIRRHTRRVSASRRHTNSTPIRL